MLLRGKEGAEKLPAATQQLRERARLFFAGLPMSGDGRQPFTEREEFLETSGDLYLSVRATLKLLEAEMERLKDIDEAPGLQKRVARLRTRARIPARIERQQHGLLAGAARLRRSGSEASRHEQTAFVRSPGTPFCRPRPSTSPNCCTSWSSRQIPTVVLTSATLTVQGGFEHMRQRLGLNEARELVVPSHFHYGEQALLYLPPEMPDPRDPEFPEAAAECIRRVLDITRGRAFCLFTSYSQMRDLYERLLPVLDFPILLHGTAPRKALLEEFRFTPNAVLFGTASFWQGVDVQGEALSCVIIDRLPFAVPSDPWCRRA